MKTTLPILLCAGMLGCAAPAVKFDQTQRAPTTSVDVFRKGSKPTKPYKEIAQISYETWRGADAQATAKLIERAQGLGANAVIMLPSQGTGYTYNMFGRSGNKSVWKAVAVVYDPAP